jgi:torulene dioxygenase
MVAAEAHWPNQAGFDTDYEKHEPVDLVVKGTIPHYAAGVLCKYPTLRLKRDHLLTQRRSYWSSRLQGKD